MKRTLAVAIALALVCQGGIVLAQDSGGPSEESVLDAARAKYWGTQDQNDESAAPQGAVESPQDAEVPELDENVPEFDENAPPPSMHMRGRLSGRYAPFLVSFAPGLNFPFGYRDSSVALGVVGTLARDIRGIELSSVFSIARDVRGAEGAAVFSIARNMNGIQGSGVFSIAGGELRGIQGSGVFNIAETVHGFQGSGVFNIAGDVRGGQAAGVFNIAHDVHGVQVGLVNVAHEVDGLQIGLVNIAENGVDALGLAYEPQTDYLYAYWQAGSPFLYTLVGYGSPVADYEWDYGQLSVASIGLGSRTRFLGLKIDADLSAEQALGYLPYASFDWRGDWSKWEGWSQLAPYPTVKISAGLPLGRHWILLAGLKADIEVNSWGSRIPAVLKAGQGWSGRICGEDFTVWPKWFFGFKF